MSDRVNPIWLWVPALESAYFSGIRLTRPRCHPNWHEPGLASRSGCLTWTAAPKANAEVLTMKRFRLRLSVLLWLVAIAAAFLAGIRYGEYRAGPRRAYVTAIDLAFPVKPTNSHAGP